jgi:hypothetical protein
MGSCDYHSINGSSNGKPIAGLSLAHSRLTKPKRALLGAELVSGTRVLVSPTIGQAADLVDVSPTSVRMALKIIENEKLLALVDQGRLALADAAARPRQLALPKPVAQDPWSIAEDLVHTHGVDKVFDRVILPAISSNISAPRTQMPDGADQLTKRTQTNMSSVD